MILVRFFIRFFIRFFNLIFELTQLISTRLESNRLDSILFYLYKGEDIAGLVKDADRNLLSLCIEKVIVPKVKSLLNTSDLRWNLKNLSRGLNLPKPDLNKAPA